MNQAVSDLEIASYRVVVGNNTITTHPVLGAIPVKGCFPLPVTKTGTISTDNAGATVGLVVIGVGTQFKFQIDDKTYRVAVGDYLADSNGVVRRVTEVNSDTMLKINAKFPSSLSAAALKVVKQNKYRWFTASSTGTAAAILNEQNFAINDKWLNDGTPFSYDVSTVNSEISFNISE